MSTELLGSSDPAQSLGAIATTTTSDVDTDSASNTSATWDFSTSESTSLSSTTTKLAMKPSTDNSTAIVIWVSAISLAIVALVAIIYVVYTYIWSKPASQSVIARYRSLYERKKPLLVPPKDGGEFPLHYWSKKRSEIDANIGATDGDVSNSSILWKDDNAVDRLAGRYKLSDIQQTRDALSPSFSISRTDSAGNGKSNLYNASMNHRDSFVSMGTSNEYPSIDRIGIVPGELPLYTLSPKTLMTTTPQQPPAPMLAKTKGRIVELQKIALPLASSAKLTLSQSRKPFFTQKATIPLQTSLARTKSGFQNSNQSMAIDADLGTGLSYMRRSLTPFSSVMNINESDTFEGDTENMLASTIHDTKGSLLVDLTPRPLAAVANVEGGLRTTDQNKLTPSLRSSSFSQAGFNNEAHSPVPLERTPTIIQKGLPKSLKIVGSGPSMGYKLPPKTYGGMSRQDLKKTSVINTIQRPRTNRPIQTRPDKAIPLIELGSGLPLRLPSEFNYGAGSNAISASISQNQTSSQSPRKQRSHTNHQGDFKQRIGPEVFPSISPQIINSPVAPRTLSLNPIPTLPPEINIPYEAVSTLVSDRSSSFQRSQYPSHMSHSQTSLKGAKGRNYPAPPMPILAKVPQSRIVPGRPLQVFTTEDMHKSRVSPIVTTLSHDTPRVFSQTSDLCGKSLMNYQAKSHDICIDNRAGNQKNDDNPFKDPHEVLESPHTVHSSMDQIDLTLMTVETANQSCGDHQYLLTSLGNMDLTASFDQSMPSYNNTSDTTPPDISAIVTEYLGRANNVNPAPIQPSGQLVSSANKIDQFITYIPISGTETVAQPGQTLQYLDRKRPIQYSIDMNSDQHDAHSNLMNETSISVMLTPTDSQFLAS
ncbi:hypothetical protein BASA50_011159 [Batrachochytrium salamandrivorans]|uniref:Uncharacterized protein n=1 Tax=Batrachochytrium salamandrivorans TaxID=1357716 RepID=A0ABQ8EWY9_9FUNG|nr:hypothetical protein BASA50_011159 [Batrachochytrium salamandrivorans]KAH6589055.1 hypothetical protein BASA61_005759 [Batrachochytrium salamandrivorans]